MGGRETEVTGQTKHIFLESAHFDPGSIRRTARALNLSTEASYRFERHVDPELVAIAAERAAELLAEHAGGELVLGRIDVYPSERAAAEIALRPARTNAILGTSLAPAEIAHSLRRLGLTVLPGDPLRVIVPTFRPDLVKEIDLIEEVGRMTGYDRLPETVPARLGTAATDSPLALFCGRIRNILAGAGLHEATTYSFAPVSVFDEAALDRRITIRHALSAELSGLRLSLVPNLLQALAHNIRQRQLDVRLFEVGKVFFRSADGTEFSESRRVAGVLTGKADPRSWYSADSAAVDFYAAKGVVERLTAALKVPGIAFAPGSVTGMHPGRTASVLLNDAVIGYVAEVDPDVAREALDLPSGIGRIAVFELDVELLLRDAPANGTYASVPRFPAVSRDISVELARDVTFAAIERLVRSITDPEMLDDLAVVSIYTGERVAADKKAVAFRMTFRAPDRTLTDVEVDAQTSDVESALRETLNAVRR